ncbi:MAG TPA: hypothetical protein VGR73_03825 [Bryobacteraceae bacterium]|nr:hypothetical protein [Bryobacteraceae bacterium]
MNRETTAPATFPRPRRVPGAWRRACELTFDLTLLALMASAALGVIVLAAAEAEYYRDTPAAVRAAASIGDTRYRERLAELVALDNPLAANEVLREAARSDPRSASAWISLGLSEERLAEARLNVEERPTEVRLKKEGRLPKRPLGEGRRAGDFARAREAFESAFRVDRQYAPAWALANFCFRRGDQECFWGAASRAAAQAPALEEASASGSPGSANLTDLRPLLDLASRMEPSPAAVLDRLGAKTNSPFAPAMERAYLDGLIGQSRWDDAMTIARRLAMRSPTHRDASDILRFDDLVTRLIAAGRASLAVGLWNDYSGYAALDPERGLSLTNGDFSRAPRNAGFDWRIGSPAGDSARARPPDGVERLWAPSVLEFRFAGGEPEQAPLAEQWLPLAARFYRLRFEYRTRDMPSPTGVHWERAAEAASSLEPCPSAWCSAQWSFSAARETWAPLRLVYRREPATARARGSLLLRNVRLEAL